jgi:regulatory protein
VKITGIKQQVKRADRYSIYIDEKYVCSFSENELLNLGLRIGQELTPEELEKLKYDSLRDKAYTRAIDLVSRRFRSEWELRDYLKRKEYEPAIVDEVLERLRERGYVDDRQFATRWIENRRLLKPTSKRKLRQELKVKRISETVIDEVLANDETDELEVLRQVVARKKMRYPDRLKFMQYLARQGYNYDAIKTVLDEQVD